MKWWTIVAVALAAGAPCAHAADTPAQAAIRKLFMAGCAGFVARDIDATMAPYSRQLFDFDIAPPQHGNYDSLRAANRQLIAMAASDPSCGYRDMFIKVYGDNAYAHYILPFSVTLKTGRKIDLEGRGTDILEKSGGTWSIVHEHFSVPADPISGQAQLKPPGAGLPPHGK